MGPPRSSRLNISMVEAAAIIPSVERDRVTVLNSVKPLLPGSQPAPQLKDLVKAFRRLY